MKITLELPDALWEEATARALVEGLTLQDLVESSLRRALENATTRRAARPLRDLRYGEGGMLEPFTWEQIRDIIHQGRGS